MIDELKLYVGEKHVINQFISVNSPTVGDLISMGENNYFTILHLLTAIPSDMKAMLWDMGICWMDISDFDFFCLLTRNLSSQDTQVFLNDLDLSSMEFGQNNHTGEHVLYKELPDGEHVVIDEKIYQQIVKILRTIHNITPKVEKVNSDTMKELLVQVNREDVAKSAKMDKTSTLLPLISSMVNSSGFKYDVKSISNLTYYAFMDAVNRINAINNANAMLSGIYGGFVDTSKLDKNQLNWMRDFRKEKQINAKSK